MSEQNSELIQIARIQVHNTEGQIVRHTTEVLSTTVLAIAYKGPTAELQTAEEAHTEEDNRVKELK